MATLEAYLGPLAAGLPEPNYVDPETRVSVVLGTEVSLTALMAVFLSARFYTRIVVTSMTGWDDAIIGLAAVIAVAQTIVICLGTKYGIAYHLWDIRPDNLSTGFKMMTTSVVLFYPVAALSKISVCLGYLRLFPYTANWWFCHAMILYSGMWGVATFLVAILRCRPVTLFWNRFFCSRCKCVDRLAFFESAAVLNSLGDLLVFLWPARFLFELNMPLRRRLGLITLFSFGCCVFAASVVRIIWLPSNFTTVDVLYYTARNLIAMSVEGNISIICGCLPTAKAFLAHFFPRVFGATPRPVAMYPGVSNYRRRARQHNGSGSRTNPAFFIARFGYKDREAYELQAGDSFRDLDEQRLVAHGSVPPTSGIVKMQEFVLRSSPLDREDAMAGTSQSSYVETSVGCHTEDRKSTDTRNGARNGHRS